MEINQLTISNIHTETQLSASQLVNDAIGRVLLSASMVVESRADQAETNNDRVLILTIASELRNWGLISFGGPDRITTELKGVLSPEVANV